MLNSFMQRIWEIDLSQQSGGKRALIFTTRLLYALVRDLMEGQLTLRAMSLVYTTLLSLVPLLAVSFSVLKGFGVHNQIEPILLKLMEPMGEKGVEITERIIGFVENMRADVLGYIGLAFLLYTVVSLIQKIERTFNFTWHIHHHRGFAQRFGSYLGVLLTGPVLVFAAVGISASLLTTPIMQSLAEIEPFGTAIKYLTRSLPYILIIFAFTLIYIFVPNTRVRFRSAFLGALIAGILWETLGWAFASFVIKSASYTAIYSAFASLILFMIWLHLGWLILLIGASIAFYHQNPTYLLTPEKELRLSISQREILALNILELIGKDFIQGKHTWNLYNLSRHFKMPVQIIKPVIEHLVEQGLLLRVADRREDYSFAKPLDEINLGELRKLIREPDSKGAKIISLMRNDTESFRLYSEIENAISSELQDKTLEDLLKKE